MATHVLAAVLWDMDGTLVDSEPTWMKAQARMAAEHGAEWTHADGLALVGSDMVATAEALQRAGVRLSSEQITDQLTDEVIAALGREVAWRSGAFELVQAIQAAGIPQAIVTTSSRAMTQLVADSLPEGAIAVVVAGEDVERSKPDPEPYLTAARSLGVEPPTCVAIEDSPAGLSAAIAAGVAVIGVPNDTALTNPGHWFRFDSLSGVVVEDLVRVVIEAQAWTEAR